MKRPLSESPIPLPEPRSIGGSSLPELLQSRRSRRTFLRRQLTLADLADLLWSGLGVTGPDGLRTVPSAGGLNPLDLYVATGAVRGLPSATYLYRAIPHDLIRVRDGDVRAPIARASWNQTWIGAAAAIFAITGIYRKTTEEYGREGIRFVQIEVGHVVQNIYLQSTSLGLGTTVIGAYDEDRVKRLIGLSRPERVLALMPVGKVARRRSGGL